MDRGVVALLGLLALGACGAPARRPGFADAARSASSVQRATPNVPDFASRPYAPFSRQAAVAIALREWRLFGQPVDDEPPDTRPPLPPDLKPERMEGLWQRVGEYWYESQDADRPEATWTGRHAGFGAEFPADDDGEYAWSAAFVSYVMRIAGAAGRFPYAASHHVFINQARRAADDPGSGWAITALPIDAYAPLPGDIMCASRTPRPMRFTDLPARGFPAHCDIVAQTAPGLDTVIGGNVDDAVTAKHVPTLADGRLGLTADRPLDTRYPWFVVLRVSYDALTVGPASTPKVRSAAFQR